jgi:hypothetical protein
MVSQKVRKVVTPAKAGVHKYLNFLDSRFCGNDEKSELSASSGFFILAYSSSLESDSSEGPCPELVEGTCPELVEGSKG